ncbi:hypothetical protein PAPHI01_1046 [Pancytospora philotis]|nr:hypothetical protein PAPHI01_1046 [Pancytospora philotis]
MQVAAWGVCAFLPLGVLSAAVGTQVVEAPSEPILTLERYFNPDYEFLGYEIKQSKGWIRFFLRTLATSMQDVDREVMELCRNIEFKKLFDAIYDDDFSDIGSVRSNVFDLLNKHPVLCERLLQFKPQHPSGKLCLYKFFTGRRPGPPLSRDKLGPELRDFMEKIDEIPKDIQGDKKLRYCDFIKLADYSAVDLMALLTVRSDWKREQSGREIDELSVAMLAKCDSETLFVKVIEPIVVNMHIMGYLEDETRCRAVLGMLVKLSAKFSATEQMKFFAVRLLSPVTRRCLVEALADEWKQGISASWSVLSALPDWCYRCRDLLREHPDEIFAALCRVYSPDEHFPSSFVDLCKEMLLCEGEGLSRVNAMPPLISYLMLYFMRNDFGDVFSKLDRQKMVKTFFGWLADDAELAVVLCLDAIDEDSDVVSNFKRRLRCLSPERRESLSAWIENNPNGAPIHYFLWSESMKAMLKIVLRLLKQ